jgi:hydroxyacylglutathione hydrolase
VSVAATSALDCRIEHELPDPAAGLMLFRQITHDDLGCASYLIGDEHSGIAAVVDPRFEIDEYLELARYHGVKIEHVLETHNHADHVSGHGRLVAATGARIHIHRAAAPSYDHEPFEDGWELALGSLLIRALHTPGHRPEHTAFLLTDTRRGGEPWALLSGDSLFVGEVARTDLAVEPSLGAAQIFDSVRHKLLTLPDDCELWPAHLGGSMCGGAGMDLKICSTIGFEKRHNPALAIEDEAEFVARALAGRGPQPPNFQSIVALNRCTSTARSAYLRSARASDPSSHGWPATTRSSCSSAATTPTGGARRSWRSRSACAASAGCWRAA